MPASPTTWRSSSGAPTPWITSQQTATQLAAIQAPAGKTSTIQLEMPEGFIFAGIKIGSTSGSDLANTAPIQNGTRTLGNIMVRVACSENRASATLTVTMPTGESRWFFSIGVARVYWDDPKIYNNGSDG